ncbi:site-2 protease family protein [Halospeciosus flavus]|uniref:Zinc metalloprotease n=1 Tax=Halospeciosus flavus TaxID=3032283 RepID=A0ABD5Z0U2_9EURY|nr:site-2 protease family protein [Halospeciosus flavus]
MRNYTIGRVWDIPIRVNISLLVFLPVLAWLIGSGTQIEVYTSYINTFAPTALDPATLQAGNTPWIVGVGAAVALFTSVAIHELGHSWAAMRYGIQTESITLWILGGLAALSEMPKEWNRELWIALAGPVTSVLVAAAAYLVVLVLPASTPILAFVFGWAVVTNLLLAVFNMLPAFPMDGGRVLRALLARSQPYPVATRRAARVGTLFAVGFAVVGVLSFSPMMLLLALFVYGAATSESRTVALDAALEGLTVRDVTTVEKPTIDADASLNEFVDELMRTRKQLFLVEEHGRVVGTVSMADLQRASKIDREAMRVSDVMVTDHPRLTPDDDAFEALATLAGDRRGVAFVEVDDETVGAVTREDFTELLSFQKEFVA